MEDIRRSLSGFRSRVRSILSNGWTAKSLGGGTLPGSQADQAGPVFPLPEGAPLLQGVPQLLE